MVPRVSAEEPDGRWALRRLMAAAAGRLLVAPWLDALHGMPACAAIAALARPGRARLAYSGQRT